jgi:hypothetical protein
MSHEDHVSGRAGGDRGQRAAGVRRQDVRHRGRAVRQLAAAAAAQVVDAPAPAERCPVAALGEQDERAAAAEAGRQPPDLLGALPRGRPRGVRLLTQEDVGQAVGQDVHARVQLQRGLHDHAGTAPARAEQMVDEQQRVARARVPAEHDERAVAGTAAVRAGHRNAQAAGAARRTEDQVEEPAHDAVLAGLVGLRVQPPAEPARDPQAEEDGQRRDLACRPGKPEEDHPQQP